MKRTVRVLRATESATPALIVEQQGDEAAPPAVELVEVDDKLKLAKAPATVTAAALKSADAWLAARGLTRSGEWQAAEPEGFRADLTGEPRQPATPAKGKATR